MLAAAKKVSNKVSEKHTPADRQGVVGGQQHPLTWERARNAGSQASGVGAEAPRWLRGPGALRLGAAAAPGCRCGWQGLRRGSAPACSLRALGQAPFSPCAGVMCSVVRTSGPGCGRCRRGPAAASRLPDRAAPEPALGREGGPPFQPPMTQTPWGSSLTVGLRDPPPFLTRAWAFSKGSPPAPALVAPSPRGPSAPLHSPTLHSHQLCHSLGFDKSPEQLTSGCFCL